MVVWIRRGFALGILAAYAIVRVSKEYAEWQVSGWLLLPPLAAWWLTRRQATRVWPGGLDRVLLALGGALGPIPASGLLPALSAGLGVAQRSVPRLDRVLSVAAAGVMTHELLLRTLLWVPDHDSVLRLLIFVGAGTLFLLVEALLTGAPLRPSTRRPFRFLLGAFTVAAFTWLTAWLSLQPNPAGYIVAWVALAAAVWFASRLGERDSERALEFYLLSDVVAELNRAGTLATRLAGIRYHLRKRAPAETVQFFVANRGDGWISIDDSTVDSELPRLLTTPQLDAEAESRPPTAFPGRLAGRPVVWLRLAKRLGRKKDPALNRWLSLCADLIARTVEIERSEWLQGRDDETGLPTLEWFHAQVQREWTRAERYVESFAVVWLRTSTSGWSVETQQQVAQLHKELRPCDELARVDPRALAILLPRTEESGATTVAERLRERLGSEFMYGVAAFPSGEIQNSGELCMVAEQRATKMGGRSQEPPKPTKG